MSAIESTGGGATDAWPALSVVDPDQVFDGVVLITVPHMDDEALACGATIARLSAKDRVHLVYATDGMKAPEPILPWIDQVRPDLGAIRRNESIDAVALLGVPRQNVHFLNLPESRLERHQGELAARLASLIDQINPDHLLTPFRYDRHRDHVALNRVVTAAVENSRRPVRLTEYFVYHKWRLLPERDVRRYIRASEMFQVCPEDMRSRKRAALDCFKSQTTRFYAWQTRPNLTSRLLDEVSGEPELFLRYNTALRGSRVFTRSVAWIRAAHRLESPLKRFKDRVVAVCRRPFLISTD